MTKKLMCKIGRRIGIDVDSLTTPQIERQIEQSVAPSSSCKGCYTHLKKRQNLKVIRGDSSNLRCGVRN